MPDPVSKAADTHKAMMDEKIEAITKVSKDIADNAATMDLKDLRSKLDTLQSLGRKLSDVAEVVNVSKRDATDKANISLHGAGAAHASSLVRNGKVDDDSSWSFSTDDGNTILGDPPDWEKYGSWHLGITPGDDTETKAHWHYPFGKFGKVFRSGLVAIRQRAGQQNDTEVFDAAGRLLADIDDGKEKADRLKKIYEDAQAMAKRIKDAGAITADDEKVVKAMADDLTALAEQPTAPDDITKRLDDIIGRLDKIEGGMKREDPKQMTWPNDMNKASV